MVVSSLFLAVFLLSEEVVDVTGFEGKGDLTGSAFLSVVDAEGCSSSLTVGVGNTFLTLSFSPLAAIVVAAVTLSKVVILPKVDTDCCSSLTVGVGNTFLTLSFSPLAAIVVAAVTLSKVVILPKVDTDCCC